MHNNIENYEVDEHRRRTDLLQDALEEKIVSLIEETDSSKDKAYLLILMKINDSLFINTNNISKITSKIKDMSERMDARIKHEDAILNRTKGWKDILVYLLTIIQTLIIGYAVSTSNSIKELQNHVIINTKDIESIKEVIKK
jgi:hypothetical protein